MSDKLSREYENEQLPVAKEEATEQNCIHSPADAREEATDQNGINSKTDTTEECTNQNHTDAYGEQKSTDSQSEDASAENQRRQRAKARFSETLLRVKEFVKPEPTQADVSERTGAEAQRSLSMNFFFALLIMAEILVIVAGSSGLLELVHTISENTKGIPDVVWLVAISIILGSLTSVFLIRFFSAPIFTLGAAVNRVAEGDFSVRLDTDRGFAEIRKINGSFNKMVKELGATETLSRDFVSNVSHEFKTPITAIEGYATLLGGSEGTTEEQKEYIDKILFNTGRLSALVGNILLLSKVDNSSIPDKKVKYRLDEQIRQSIVALEPKWSEKNQTLEVELDEIYYDGAESLMFHVWNNLIDNAIKFGPADSTVKISLTRIGEKTVFTVSDEGEGIPKEDIKHVFDRFYQSDSSHKAEGNGLGLALVKQIVERVGGEVSASNGEECGAVFTVTL